MFTITSSSKLIACFIFFIIAMLACRCMYTGSVKYIFLLWNLFLAWLPFQLSKVIVAKKNVSKKATYFLLALWLLFFPNALYIITDLIHLQTATQDAPVWFDAILLFTSSIAGLIMAFASLLKIESYLQRSLRNAIVERIVMGCIFLGSFGVYLGRFLRWNSWDIIADPIKLFTQIIAPFILPLQHFRTWGVTLLLTCLFSLLYFTIKKLPGLLKEPGNNFIQ